MVSAVSARCLDGVGGFGVDGVGGIGVDGVGGIGVDGGGGCGRSRLTDGERSAPAAQSNCICVDGGIG